VAVTVEHEQFVILDSGDRIVGVGPHAESQFGPLVGSVVWDCFAGSKPVFRPYYEKARRSGKPVEFVQYHDGFVSRVSATPRARGELEVGWEVLARVDTTTLDSLAESLAACLDLLDDELRDAHRDELRRTLRLIEGGA
jgi:hypothetical protein